MLKLTFLHQVIILSPGEMMSCHLQMDLAVVQSWQILMTTLWFIKLRLIFSYWLCAAELGFSPRDLGVSLGVRWELGKGSFNSPCKGLALSFLVLIPRRMKWYCGDIWWHDDMMMSEAWASPAWSDINSIKTDNCHRHQHNAAWKLRASGRPARGF